MLDNSNMIISFPRFILMHKKTAMNSFHDVEDVEAGVFVSTEGKKPLAAFSKRDFNE